MRSVVKWLIATGLVMAVGLGSSAWVGAHTSKQVYALIYVCWFAVYAFLLFRVFQLVDKESKRR